MADGKVDYGMVTDVRTMRMKNMGVDGTMGFVVEVKVAGRWIRVLADGDRAQAEMVAAKARREAGLA